MNSRPLQPSVLLSLTERIVSGVGKAVHAAGALWGNYTARRRDARAVDAIADMNAHMLRDIGAHDRLIAHAAARKDADHRRRIAFQLSTPLLVVTLIAAVTLGAAAEAADSRPTGTAPATAQLIGSFTGEYVNGAPVYRLPSVIVVASRKVERVKLEREERSTRAQQARAKAAARKPA
ncbi:MAG TPA: hypothetical protein VGK75_03855 [Casimicrobiaceae bacterium]